MIFCGKESQTLAAKKKLYLGHSDRERRETEREGRIRRVCSSDLGLTENLQASLLAWLIDWVGEERSSLFLSHIILLIHHHPSCPNPNCLRSSSLFGLVDLTANQEKRDGSSGGGCASSSLGSKCLEKSRLILLCSCTYPSPAIHGFHRRCRKRFSWSVCDLSLSFSLSDALVFCFFVKSKLIRAITGGMEMGMREEGEIQQLWKKEHGWWWYSRLWASSALLYQHKETVVAAAASKGLFLLLTRGPRRRST